MTVRGITGAAGTGKTTRLLEELEARLSAVSLGEGQRVLALTYMHGSRLRLTERLAASSARGRFDCSTFDRFAWGICRRWRTRLRERGIDLVERVGADAYDATCTAAASLLSDPQVGRWVATRYPIVVVDEFQDCDVARLGVVQHLAEYVEVLVAADEFQRLGAAGSESVAWLGTAASRVELIETYRTRQPGLLAAAHALRSGSRVVEGPGIRIVSLPAAQVAASFISKTLAGQPAAATVLLSPVLPSTSPFVRRVIALVETKRYGNAGPLPLAWEKRTTDLEAAVLEETGLGAGDESAEVEAATALRLATGPVAHALSRWVEHERRTSGQLRFNLRELRVQVHRAAQSLRMLPSTGRRRRVMTIHQAKNREFPRVVVLWPLAVRKDPEAARRLLYNAITRAKEHALVIVEDPKKERLAQPPFSATPPE